MEKSTIITLLIVVGLGGLALWYFMSDATSVGAQPVPDNCGGGVMGSIGKFIQGHTDRKNTAAPYVAQMYTGAGASTVKPITDIAGKLSPSGYAEKWIGDKVGGWFCDAKLPGWGEVKDWGAGVTSANTSFATGQLKAGTVGPVKSLYSAGSNLVHGNFGDAASDIYHSAADGPKAAYNATKDLAKAIIPGW
jgi:hypothetical protein